MSSIEHRCWNESLENSSPYVNNEVIMGINMSYSLDDHVCLASGSTRLRVSYTTANYGTVLVA